MNAGSDVMEVLRRANPVPVATLDERALPDAAQLIADFGARPGGDAPLRLDTGREPLPRRWPAYAACAAVLLAVVVVLVVLPRGHDDPVEPATTAPPPPTTVGTAISTTVPFVGEWISIDVDGSRQTMTIASSGESHEIVVHDDSALVCAGGPSTMTGTGEIDAAGALVVARPAYSCDDGSTPLPADPELALAEILADLSFVLGTSADELTDSLGVVWWRAGTTPEGAAAVPLPLQQAALAQVVQAVVAAAEPGASDALTSDALAETATIVPVEGWPATPVTDADALRPWLAHLRTWGWDADVRECWIGPQVPGLTCAVTGRWHAVRAEADEYWHAVFDGDRIRTLSISVTEERTGQAEMPLALHQLAGWEAWLRQTDPAAADRLLAGPASSSVPLVLRYDPALAPEITASIETYLAHRPPGDTITVSDDLIDLGEGLVGLIGNMDRDAGRTYVVAGHYETNTDLWRAPERAVLAAFDADGTELWRTELDGIPVQVEAVGDDVWVLHGVGRLSRIRPSDGRILDRLEVPPNSTLLPGFGTVWVQTSDFGEAPAELIRINPDLSTTPVRLPIGRIDPDHPAAAAVAGVEAIWVPRGGGGVAVVDPVSLAVTVLPRDAIGHDVLRVAFDGDVAFVASRSSVTSLVAGTKRATVTLDELGYLGRVEGVFGALTEAGFVVLGPDEPMQLDVRQVTAEGIWAPREVEGEAWMETGRNYDLRRVQFIDP